MKEKINPDLKKLTRAIAGLKPDKSNSRDHDEKNLQDIADSLVAFGQQKPIVVQKDGTVVAGNGTFKAAIKLGWTHIAAVTFDSKEQVRATAYAIADNRSAETSAWNKEMLAFNLNDIKSDFDITKLGFSADELKALNAKLFPEPEEEDEVPAPRKTNIKPGDLFKLGRHRLLCGDATIEAHVKRLMAGSKADMIFTDPPYNVDYGANKNHPTFKVRTITNDNLGAFAWENFNMAFIKNMGNHYKGGDVYVWGASGPEGMKQRLWLTRAGFRWANTIVWKKQQLVLSPANYQRIYEPAFYGWLKKSTYHGDRKQTEVWNVDRPHNSKLHPTMKPLALVKMALENSSQPGDTVMDLFGGAGSTLIAAEENQRNCVMTEIEPTYVQVIVDRWEQLTGQKADKIK